MIFLLFISFLFFFYSISLGYMVIFMLIMSVSIFLNFCVSTGSSWISLIFIMLFLGGILVVFMSVSSLYPNTKMFLIKFDKKTFLFMLLFFFFLESNFIFVNDFKWLMLSGANFFCFFFLVMVFFFCFLYMISKDKLTLRMFF